MFSMTDSADTQEPAYIRHLREAVQKLPAGYPALMRLVFRHLNSLAGLSDKTKMSAENWAEFLAPTMLVYDETLEKDEEAKKQRIKIVQFLIENYEEIFEGKLNE
jgi:hypothetical protein